MARPFEHFDHAPLRQGQFFEFLQNFTLKVGESSGRIFRLSLTQGTAKVSTTRYAYERCEVPHIPV